MQDHPRHFDPQLLLENVRWMQPLALRLVGNPDDADDVVQESWVAAVSARPATVRVHPSRWLTGVLRRVAARVHRDRAARVRHERAAVEAFSVSDPTPAQLLERAEIQRVLLETVLALDEPYRSTILLRFFEDLAPREIARRYRLAVPTVKTRLRRGLQLLRPRVLDRLGDETGRSLASLAAFATVAAGSGTAAGAGSAAGASTSFAATPTAHSYPWIGALAMSKSTLQATAILAAVSIGFVSVGFVSGILVSHFSESDLAPGAIEDADPVVSASEFSEMRSERDALEARVAALADTNRGLLARLEEGSGEVEAAVDSESETSPEPMRVRKLGPNEQLALHFKELGRRLSAAIDNGPEQRESRLQEALFELDRLNGVVRETTLAAFFDEDILVAATTGILADALGLNDAQVKALEAATRAALEPTLDQDLTDLVPVERQELRRSVASSLLDSTRELLDGESLGRWNTVEPFVRKLFSGDHDVHASGSSSETLESHFSGIWRETFEMDPDQNNILDHYAEGFARDARALLERVGPSSREFEALDDETRARMETEFRDLQVRYERDILVTLSPEQRERMLSAKPAYLRLRPGKRCAYEKAATGLFSPGEVKGRRRGP